MTLGHYTQAVRGGEVAVAALEGAYSAPGIAQPQAPAEASARAEDGPWIGAGPHGDAR